MQVSQLAWEVAYGGRNQGLSKYWLNPSHPKNEEAEAQKGYIIRLRLYS